LTASLGDDAEDAYPYLAGLLGLTLEREQEERIRVFAPDAVQRQTVDWMFQLITAIARERPLCVVLEDLHWSDDATRSLLEELLSAVEQEPVAFLLVHRSDPDHPAWQLADGGPPLSRRLS
jgi:predicted ATPase